jgi:DNA invertase Pin-like site-specific DNA recombinase
VTPAENAIYGLDATGKRRHPAVGFPRRVTVEQARHAVELRAAGWTQAAIARETGLGRYALYAILGGWRWTIREGHVRLPEQGGVR